jgi:Sulfotransferase family
VKSPKLPNFFIAGAPKSGTTSLYHYLDQHPDIHMSRIKEPNYFASEIRLENFSEWLRPRAEKDGPTLRAYLNGPMREKRFGGMVTEWSDYLRLFRKADAQKAIGEASVCYLWSESAAANIRRALPDARIILILRNPVEMVFSMYLHNRRSEGTSLSFREAIQKGIEQRGGGFDIFHPFLDMGLYYEQVKRVLEAFPKDQVRIYWYEEYKSKPLRMLSDIFRFLEVDPRFRPDMSKRYLEAGAPPITLEPADRAFLTEFYREDVEKLATLLTRDLSGWL